MADKNITMQVRNMANTAWDKIYPKTKAELVDFSDGTTVESHKAEESTNAHQISNIEGLSTALNGKLGDQETAVNSTKWDGYEVQKDGTDGTGIINFKTE